MKYYISYAYEDIDNTHIATISIKSELSISYALINQLQQVIAAKININKKKIIILGIMQMH